MAKKAKYTDKQKIQVLCDTLNFLLNALQGSELIDDIQLNVLKSKLQDVYTHKYALKNTETYFKNTF